MKVAVYHFERYKFVRGTVTFGDDRTVIQLK